jgi:hypothetical protein
VQDVRVTSKALEVVLRDGRTLSVPLEWYPRLAHGTPRERQKWRLIGDGIGIHWPELDEDISISGFAGGASVRGKREVTQAVAGIATTA